MKDDLISRSELEKEMRQIDWSYLSLRFGGDLSSGIDRMYELVEEAPAIDAKKVVYAEWEKDPSQRRVDGHIYDYRCSNCYTPAEKGYYNNCDRFTNYCPYCGATMKGKK